MDSAILYLPYLPNVFWFRNFLKHEAIFIEREEKFVKSSFRNRCTIAGANGQQVLSIPLCGGRDHRRFYKDVRIAYGNNWERKHWLSIRSAYGSSPFYEFFADQLERVYEKEIEFLFDFNLELLYVLLHLLKIRKGFDFTTIYEKNTTDIIDLRSARKSEENIKVPRYYQVFEDRNGFIPNLSVLDVLFNMGLPAKDYLFARQSLAP